MRSVLADLPLRLLTGATLFAAALVTLFATDVDVHLPLPGPYLVVLAPLLPLALGAGLLAMASGRQGDRPAPGSQPETEPANADALDVESLVLVRVDQGGGR